MNAIEETMEQSCVGLAALVTDEPEHRPIALAGVRALLAYIGTVASDSSGLPIAGLATAVGHDADVWIGPHRQDGGVELVGDQQLELEPGFLIGDYCTALDWHAVV
jgi:hypothetical protein